MKINKSIFILFFSLVLSFMSLNNVFAGLGPVFEFFDFDVSETDSSDDTLVFFFDLRDRETYIQLTHTDTDFSPAPFTPGSSLTMHIQIFDVSNNCNENDFFDVYTPLDTHVYNMRDIQTNDGNPSGVVLPDNAYGFVFALVIEDDGTIFNAAEVLIGNLRILDEKGYEYRTNGQSENAFDTFDFAENFGFFNFNTFGNVTLSDIVGVVFSDNGDGNEGPDGEVVVADVLENFAVVNIDVFDNSENPFSCRNVIFACVNEDSPLLEELLEVAAENSSGSASVARVEYGINNAIPHSKGGELLCPGNQISEGFVRMEILNDAEVLPLDDIVVFIGLNNGNGRGSMDALWIENIFTGGGGDVG